MGETYPVVCKRHRFLSYNKLAKKTVTGYCVCRETIDDNGNLIQFTEYPSAKWHRPMIQFSTFRPEVEALQEAPCDWQERARCYSQKYGFEFYPAQLREVGKLLGKDAALVAAEVGSGKTLLAATFIGLRTRRKHTTVIVAPNGVHPQWQEELRRFTGRRAISVDDPGSLAPGINLINIEAFRGKREFNRPVDLLIADEGHFMASLSGQTDAFLEATEGIGMRLILTATPVPNRVEELFLLLGWLSHKYWNCDTLTHHQFPYSRSELEKFKTDYCLSDGAIGVASSERINKLLEPFLVSLTKSECLSSLPPLKLKFVPCSIPVSVKQSWDKCFKLGSPSNTETDFLTATPRVFGKTAKAWSEICGSLRNGHQVLVVSVRTEPLEELARLLARHSISTSKIYSEAAGDYATEAENFRSGTSRVMLMGMKCAQSYNFPNCARVIIIGSDFTYGMFHQALGRCHRLTSRENVHVHVLYYTGTNEAIKLQTVIAKAVQAATVLGERDYQMISEITNCERTVSDTECLTLMESLSPAPLGA